MTEDVADFLGLPNAPAPEGADWDVDAERADLQGLYETLSADYDDLATAIYSPWASSIGGLATDLRCVGDDCATELLAALKSGMEGLAPLQRKLANDFYGQLGVAYTELNAGIAELIDANPEAGDLLPPPPLEPVTGELIRDELPPDRPPYVPPTWEPPAPPEPLPVQPPTGCGIDFGGFLPAPGAVPGIPGPSPGAALGGNLSGFLVPVPTAANGFGLLDNGIGGQYFFTVPDCLGREQTYWAVFDASTGCSTVTSAFGPIIPDDACQPPAPPTPRPPDPCPTGPACLADLTAENVRRALFKINTAQTSIDREKAVQGLVSLMGVHLEAGKATSDWDCPPEEPEPPATCEPPGDEPPAGLPRPSLTSPPDWCSEDVCSTLRPPDRIPPGGSIWSGGVGGDFESDLDTLPVSADGDGTETVTVSKGTTNGGRTRTGKAGDGTGPDGGTDTGEVPATGNDVDCPSILGDPSGWIGCQFNAALKAIGLPECSSAFVGQFLGGLIEKYVGVDMTPVLQPYRYWANWCEPTLIPSPVDLHGLYLEDAIDADQWECLTKANGLCEVWAKKVRDSGRLRISADDAYRMHAMGTLSDREYKDELRKNAAVVDEDTERWKKSKEAVPSPGDVLRFVSRDVEDLQIVNRFGLDADFDKAYAGYSKKALTANGINEELAKRYYRANWELPSPTQGYQMLHRLRPGRVKPDIEFGEADLSELLKAADYPEYFRKRLEEVSYAVPTRTDAERLYDAGEWTRKEYEESLQDAGYKKDFAEKLSKFFERDKERQQRSRLATFTTGDAVNWFREGYVDETFLADRMRMEIDDDDAIQKAIDAAKVESSIADMKESVALARTQFVNGCADETAAAVWMRQAGVPDGTIERNLERWKMQRSCSARQITASDICKMVERGLLGKAEALRRLVRIGFSPEDAELALQNCVADISERMYKELMKQLEKMERERKANIKEEEKRRKAAAKLAKCGPEVIKCPK